MSGARYFNRELSWLEFNTRVLAIVADPTVPLLERVKFCAIFSTNLDEFYEVRVAGLKDQQASGHDLRSPDGSTPGEQLALISARVDELTARQASLFIDELVPELAMRGIEIVRWLDLTEHERKSLEEMYDERIFPVLTPLAVDPGHPFPYISNLSLNLGASVVDPTTGERRFARVKVPPLLPRFIPVGSHFGHVGSEQGELLRLLPLEELIADRLSSLFPGMHIESAWPFRVTRNADLDLEEEEAEDLLAAVETELRRRRFGRAVRLEVTLDMPVEMVELLCDELELDNSDVIRIDGLLDLAGLAPLRSIDRPDLKDEGWTPRTPSVLAPHPGDDEADVFAVMRRHDILVHHPYDSFATSVERFVRQAAADPDVLAIKLTLYRTSGDSPVVQAAIDAAERGKQVAVLIELKARFDEQVNIAWAKALEQVGVHVVYGIVGLKTHTKVALVVRSEKDGLRRYCHVATGNYNSSTARLYEDFGLFSCDPVLGQDLTLLFNSLTGYSKPANYERLIVAPEHMRERMIELIRNEHVGRSTPGSIVMKMNSLVDAPVIDALYEASRAGVRIDLIVRGICCLRPGVPGLSENIHVRSIVGRFLEHSRLYLFANAAGDGIPGYYIGSADMMPRNLDRRVEAIVPVSGPALEERLQWVLDVLLRDNCLAWALHSDGTWSRVLPVGDEPLVDSHATMQRKATERSHAGLAA